MVNHLHTRKQHLLGFTLIELMITVAVIGILSAIAYPSYVGQVQKGRRADAQAALMNVAARQQQSLLDTRAYAASVSALSITLPTSVTQWYDVTVSAPATTTAAPVPTFTVQAAPKGNQATDSCGTLIIDQNGSKTTSPSTTSGCW
jgi:type IV pilus assembly protein PilE